MAEPPNSPVSPKDNNLDFLTKVSKGEDVDLLKPLPTPPGTSIMDRKITPTGRSAFSSVLNPTKYRSRETSLQSPPQASSISTPRHHSSGNHSGKSVRAIVDWLEKTSGTPATETPTVSRRKFGGSMDSTRIGEKSNNTSARVSLEKEDAANTSDLKNRSSPLFGPDLPKYLPHGPVTTVEPIGATNITKHDSTEVSSDAPHKRSISIESHFRGGLGQQPRVVSSPAASSIYNTSAPQTPAVTTRQQRYNNRQVSGVFSPKTPMQPLDESQEMGLINLPKYNGERRGATMSPTSPVDNMQPSSPLANIDGVEESLTLGDYKQFFNNRPLARCLDNVDNPPPIPAGIPDELRRQLEAPLVDLTPEFNALVGSALPASPAAHVQSTAITGTDVDKKTNGHAKTDSHIRRSSAKAIDDLMNEVISLVTKPPSPPPVPALPIAANPPSRPPPRTPTEANAYWNSVRAALAPSDSDDSNGSDEESSYCSGSVVSFPLLLMDKLEQEKKAQQEGNGASANGSRGMSQSPARRVENGHVENGEYDTSSVYDAVDTDDLSPVRAPQPLQLRPLPPPVPMSPYDQSGPASPTAAPRNGTANGNGIHKQRCDKEKCTNPNHKHRHRKRENGKSVTSGTTSVSGKTSGVNSTIGSVRSRPGRHRRMTTEEKMSEVNDFLTSSTTENLLMPEGKIVVPEQGGEDGVTGSGLNGGLNGHGQNGNGHAQNGHKET